MTWFFNGKPFTEAEVGKYEGFVYMITDKTDPVNLKHYIGKKFFWEIRKVKGKRNRQRTMADWQNYWSSSEKLKKLVKEKGEENFHREILSLHITRGDTNMCEIKYQFQLDVLESKDFYNETISKYNKVSERIVKGRIISPLLENIISSKSH